MKNKKKKKSLKLYEIYRFKKRYGFAVNFILDQYCFSNPSSKKHYLQNNFINNTFIYKSVILKLTNKFSKEHKFKKKKKLRGNIKNKKIKTLRER